MITGIRDLATASFTLRVTAAAESALAANGSPKVSSTLGQEMFTSIASGLARAMLLATSPNSAAVAPKMLAKTGTPRGSNCDLASFSMPTSTSMPGFARPIALRRPPFHSMQVGLAWPLRGVGPQLLAVTAPHPATAMRSKRLAEVPKNPLASTSGVDNMDPRNSTFRLGSSSVKSTQFPFSI